MGLPENFDRKYACQARVYTDSYQIYGTLQLIPRSGTCTVFNVPSKRFLSLADVSIYTYPYIRQPNPEQLKGKSEVFMVDKEKIKWTVGGRMPSPGENHTASLFACYFNNFILAGEIIFPSGTTYIDYFTNPANMFFYLKDARVYSSPSAKNPNLLPPRELYRFAVLNLAQCVGITPISQGSFGPKGELKTDFLSRGV
jgi:hypothetical protein